MGLPTPQLPQPAAVPSVAAIAKQESQAHVTAPQERTVAAPDDAPKPDGTHEDHSARHHAKVSSSKMHRLWHCLYSVQDGLDLPPERYSEHAETGTKFHEVVEMRTRDFLENRQFGKDPNARLKDIVNNPRYTDEMVTVAEGAVQSIWEHGFQRSITNKFWDTESRFVLVEEPEVSGIPDFWMACINDKGEKEGYIWDYKNGVLPVDAKDNKQLLFLAVAMQEIMGKKRPFEKIRVAIYQPNSKDGGPAYKEHYYTKRQIEAGRAKILKIAKDVYDPPKLKSGKLKKIKAKEGSWCKFCPAESICPAKKEQLRAVALMPKKSDEIVIPPVDSLSDEFVMKVLQHKEHIRDFLNAVEETAKTRMQQGESIPGFKLVQGRSQRRVRSDLNVDQIVSQLEAQGVTGFWEKKLKGVRVLEKVVPEHVLDSLIYKTEPKLTLVPESDKRQAINPSENIRSIAAASNVSEEPEVLPADESNGTKSSSSAVKKKTRTKRKTVQRKK